MIVLSKDLADCLELGPASGISLWLGQKRLDAEVRVSNLPDRTLEIDSGFLAAEGLPRVTGPVNLYYRKGDPGVLRLGPFLGVLTHVPVFLFEDRVIALYRTIWEVARNRGMFCLFFTPDKIDFTRNTLWGLEPVLEGMWELKRQPLPDVIYNQVAAVDSRIQPAYDRLKSQAGRGFQMFHIAGLDKLTAYEVLKKDWSVRGYLPETARLDRPSCAEEMLKKHRSIILKPVFGSLGDGVVLVEALDTDEFAVRYHDGRNVRRDTHGLDSLREFLERFTRDIPYLVQQTIDRPRLEERPVDFRVHLFKGSGGRWDVLKTTARIGVKGGVATNRRYGEGRAWDLEVLGKIFGKEAAAVAALLENSSLDMARSLERNSAYVFAELAFDLAVDTEGRVFMLEVNTKPTWGTPEGRDGKKYDRDFAEHLLDYSLYLLDLSGLSKVRAVAR